MECSDKTRCLVLHSYEDHARIRGATIPAFRASAIKDHEDKIRWYVHLLVEQLGEVAKNKACDGQFDSVGQDEVTVDIFEFHHL